MKIKSKVFRLLPLLVVLLLTLTSCGEDIPDGGGIYTPFAFLLRTFNNWTSSYALALLLFALMVKVLLLPFAIKQQKNQIGAAKLRPKMLAIEKKYAGRNDQVTLRKKQEEIMALQQAEGYSPLAGCLPLLIQLPIIMLLYNIIRYPLTYICRFAPDAVRALATAVGNDALATNQIKLIHEASKLSPEAFAAATSADISVLPNFGLFGNFINLGETPSEVWGWLILVPAVNLLASVATMFLSKKLNGNMAQLQAAAATPDQRISNRIMEWAMPVMSTWIATTVPAALGVYWFFQSILGILQMTLLAKFMPLPRYTKEEMEQMLKDMKARQSGRPTSTGYVRDPNAPPPRSLHHIDDEDDDEAPVPPRRQSPSPNQNRPSSVAPAKQKSDDRKRHDDKK